ncbi:hypothetical protein [Roseiterribacter gracilis]|uniref:Polysaccharide biosynthesis protein n=1 Tax=Roseiterribacter gracilis TaxID=2812848 RepID=A0A8S8X690_9PROT|nr:hypothetical protein TMPK1_03100 [Rhodospirillales bacterium TMPK1]
MSEAPKDRFALFGALRLANAGAGLVFGLLQTAILARTLPLDSFAHYVLAGALGNALWAFDLGIARVLFTRLRPAWLDGNVPASLARQGWAVVLFYAALVLVGAVVLFAVALLRAIPDALGLAAFFAFTALNLPWFALRTLSVAVDRFVQIELAEASRRALQIGAMLLPLLGVSVGTASLIGLAAWALPVAPTLLRLRAIGAVAPGPVVGGMVQTWRSHRADLARAGSYALAELAIYNAPYAVASWLFGVGPATIVADLLAKTLRGATVLSASLCEAAVPAQTRAWHARDRAALIRTTQRVVATVALPTMCLSLLLILAGNELYAKLVADAVAMPAMLGALAGLLVIANGVQTISNHLLIHTAAFLAVSRAAVALVVCFAAGAALAFLFQVEVVRFWQGYAAIYAAGALVYATLAIQRARQLPS